MTDTVKKFIKCTSKDTRKPIYINVDRIESVGEGTYGDTKIYTGGHGGAYYDVEESVPEVMRKINGDF